MTIGRVAVVLGCSVWTVRQRYLPLGLPYFRIGSTGKFNPSFGRTDVLGALLLASLSFAKTRSGSF
jgi:hypothetical protein